MIRGIEFYSGIGGLHLALRRSGLDAEIVQAFDWDPAASQVYAKNWGNIVRRVDIARLTAEELVPLDASLWLLSPACQPYTVLNAFARDAADPRARSFLHLIETVLPDLAKRGSQPRWILVENVAGFETSITRQTLLTVMRNLGYNTQEFLLTPLQFLIPNSRLRYYLLAKLHPLTFVSSQAEHGLHYVRRTIPSNEPDRADPQVISEQHRGSSCLELRHFLDDPARAQEPEYWHTFAVPDKVLHKKGVLFDIAVPSSRRTCCFTRGYTHMVEGTSILQLNESLNTTATFDAYAATQMESPSIHILKALRLRYFTPEELLRLFHFCPPEFQVPLNSMPEPDFHWPTGISQKTKYRLIGNSVNVKVVQKLISYLLGQ